MGPLTKDYVEYVPYSSPDLKQCIHADNHYSFEAAKAAGKSSSTRSEFVLSNCF